MELANVHGNKMLTSGTLLSCFNSYLLRTGSRTYFGRVSECVLLDKPTDYCAPQCNRMKLMYPVLSVRLSRTARLEYREPGVQRDRPQNRLKETTRLSKVYERKVEKIKDFA